MERGLIDVHHICEGLLHEDSSNRGAEFLLFVPQLFHSLILRLVDHLGLPVARPVLQVDLADEPRLKLRQI